MKKLISFDKIYQKTLLKMSNFTPTLPPIIEDDSCSFCVVPEFLLELLEFFNPCKSFPLDYKETCDESITLYEYSVHVLFVNESDTPDIEPASPIEMDGRECHMLGDSYTIVRKISATGDIRLLMTFEDKKYFGDTHKFIDGTVYFAKNKFTVTDCVIYRDFMVDKKVYDYLVMCTFK